MRVVGDRRKGFNFLSTLLSKRIHLAVQKIQKSEAKQFTNFGANSEAKVLKIKGGILQELYLLLNSRK